MKATLDKRKEKLTESLQAVLPIVCIVMVLCFSVAPISPSILLCYLMGAVMIVFGLMFFTLGAETGMTPMGEKAGAAMTRTKNLWVIVSVSFILGFIITISEPDLQVLAQQVPSIENSVIVLSVALGVSLVKEKEMVFIVARSDKKHRIMQAIMDSAGLDSKAQAIAFSLPVTSVAGMRLVEADELAEKD